MDRAVLERLRWRSKRGLLELDLVFERFWKSEGARLTEGEGAALEKLLLLPDNDLLDLVMGRAHAGESELAAMVEKLRAV